jgi:hypothetical protein
MQNYWQKSGFSRLKGAAESKRDQSVKDCRSFSSCANSQTTQGSLAGLKRSRYSISHVNQKRKCNPFSVRALRARAAVSNFHFNLEIKK